jgi:hypothetical protein
MKASSASVIVSEEINLFACGSSAWPGGAPRASSKEHTWLS